MFSKSEARTLVRQELAKLESELKLVIIDDATQEYDWGWVFFYDSAKSLTSSEMSDSVAGNAPYIVNRSSGEVAVTGTALPLAAYLKEYENQLRGSKGEA